MISASRLPGKSEAMIKDSQTLKAAYIPVSLGDEMQSIMVEFRQE